MILFNYKFKRGRYIMNHMDDREFMLEKLKKKVLYILLGIIYISFIGYQVSRLRVFTDNSTLFSEFLYLPAYIAILIIPIMFLLYIFLNLKIKKLKRHREDFNFRDLITPKSIFIFVSLILMAIILIYQN